MIGRNGKNAKKNPSDDSASYTKALLNILTDFNDEKNRFVDIQKASLNILDDYAFEKRRFEETQQATLNILEDFAAETQKVEETNREMASEIANRKKLETALINNKVDLEKSLKELDGFAYSVSHDLKAPLRGIGQVVDWIYADFMDQSTAQQKEYMRLMKARVVRMDNLIDGLLSYAKVGRVGEMIQKADTKRLVSEVIDSLQPPETIEMIVEGNFPIVSCVYVQIEQVFQNLISNAVRHMDKKMGKIRIGCRENNLEWTFFVEDNGPGIARQHFERIFQIFQTLKPRDEVESTGIGLSIVKKVVELHKGRVWLESEVGQGSTFFFTLPKML